MTSINDLNNLIEEANQIEREQESAEHAMKILATLRNGNFSLSQILGNPNYAGNTGYGELVCVVNEQKTELIRLAELRLAAKARGMKIKAAQNRAIVRASIIDIPEASTGAA